jgi:hypothetical protein
MAFHLPGANDLYTVWNLDSSGNYVSDTIGAAAPNSTALESLEPSFQQDLNGDGTIGVVNVASGAGLTESGAAGLTVNVSTVMVSASATESGALLIGVPDQQHDHG